MTCKKAQGFLERHDISVKTTTDANKQKQGRAEALLLARGVAKIIVAKGYGVRKLGEATPVDERTMFGIGSNTKAFTTAALATLVDEGKLSWDDPVYQRLPGFVMYDPYVSHEMTIRDLLTHRSGMGLGEGDPVAGRDTVSRRAGGASGAAAPR